MIISYYFFNSTEQDYLCGLYTFVNKSFFLLKKKEKIKNDFEEKNI